MQSKPIARGVAWSRALNLFPLLITFLALLLPASLQAQGSSELVIPYSTGLQLKNEDMSSAALNKAQATGAKFVRKAIYWSTIETSPGVYNWSQPDTWINDMESRGFTMLITLVWNNRIYEDIWERAIVTEPGRQAFANFAADVADRYAGKDIIFEIWNEPNLRSFWHENPENVSNTDAMAEEYTELVKDAAPAMKAADPNCRIAAGSISALWSQSFSWFERCVEVGILTSGIDAISVHPYGFRWPELAMQSGYPVIRQILDTNGASTMPIITSEVGYPESWLIERGFTTANVEQAQAWQFVRQNLVDAMSGIQGTIWYELTDPSYGVLENDLAERPTFLAAQVLTSELDGYFFKEQIYLASNLDYAVVFENAFGDQKMVVWTTPNPSAPLTQRIPVNHAVSIPVGAPGSYDVVDVFGNSTTLNSSDGNLTVTLEGGPKYIPLPGPLSFYTNVALNKTATISSGSGAAKLTDGLYNTNSRWMADYNFPQWAEIDLGGLFTIDQVVIAQHQERIDSWQVEVWDGGQWVIAASSPTNANLNVVADFAPVVTSKVRVVVNSGYLYLKVFEIEVWGAAYVPPVNENVALGKTATITSGTGAGALTDGVYTTNSRWMADYGFPQSAEINLGGLHTINKVIFAQYQERTDNWEVQAWNGATWVTVTSGTANTSLTIEATFSEVVTDRVKFVVTSGSLYLKIYELEIWGHES